MICGFIFLILLLVIGRFQSLLANGEDDKFGRFEGRESDQADEVAIMDVILRHRGAVTLCTTVAQVGSWLGSKTAHRVP